MQIYFSPFSPYVRKCLVTAHELGLNDRVRLLPSNANPVTRDREIIAKNPLGKVPTFITDDGLVLYDSRVICEYIDSLGSAGIFPPAGPARWKALTRQSMGDGLLDAALLARYELTARPTEMQWPVWRQALLTKVTACLGTIEAIAPELATAGPTIGEVAIGCGLGYLDFRFPELDWRASHPAATRWYAGFAQLPAMQATLPHEA